MSQQTMNSQKISDKYTGDTASKYDSKRTDSKKWENEQDAVELLLRKVSEKNRIDTVLDIPVGTGRFLHMYDELGLDVVGMDLSEDMLSISEKKSPQNSDFVFTKGNILKPDSIEVEPDIVVCIRLLNWFSFSEVSTVLENLQSLDIEYAIVGIRTQPDEKVSFKKRLWLGHIQIISQILSLTPSGETINIHPESAFRTQVSEHNFQIENRILIDVGTSPNDYCSEYNIYLLKT